MFEIGKKRKSLPPGMKMRKRSYKFLPIHIFGNYDNLISFQMKFCYRDYFNVVSLVFLKETLTFNVIIEHQYSCKLYVVANKLKQKRDKIKTLSILSLL